MPVTIADLAEFFPVKSACYREATDEILSEYVYEKAHEVESDVWDKWALIAFADGSRLTVRQGRRLSSGGGL